MSGEWWHRMSASLDQDPRVVEAGWQATAVLGVLLRINASNRFDGLVPTRYCAESYVARFGNMPVRVVREAMVKLGESNLTLHNSDGLVLNLDELMTHGAVPVRDRVRAHRERVNDSAAHVTPGNAMKRDVTSPLVDADADAEEMQRQKQQARLSEAAPERPSDLGYQVADALREMTLKHCPEEPRFKKPSTRDRDAKESDVWAKTVPHATQLKALQWAEAQPPRGTFRWAANLRSVAKLREKYPDIAAQARTEKAGQAPSGARVPDLKTRENIEAERRAIEMARKRREAPQVERMIGGIFK